MKKLKFIIIILMLLSGKVFSNSPNIEVVDSMDNRIVISNEVNKIISLHGSISEIICALDQSEKIIAVTDSDTYPPVLKSKLKVGRQMNPSIEKIVSLKPDLILTSCTRKSQLLFLEKIKQYNIPIVVISSFKSN